MMYASTKNSHIAIENDVSETEKTEAGVTISPELRKLRPTRWIRDFLFDWAIIVATFAIVAAIGSIWIFPLAALIIGTRLHALAILAHDATHRLVFHNRKANDLIAELFITWPVFFLLEHGYRPFHFQHHRTLGTDADPELVGREHGVTWKKITRWFILDILGLGLLNIAALVWLFFPRTRLRRILGPIMLWSAFIAICAIFGTWWILGLWIWSIVILGAVFRVRGITEHSDLPWNGRETSHRFHAGWLTRFLFFPHHTYCHYEHHLHPQVPYYNLPAVRKLIVGKPILPLRELFPV